jgi:uncharacterized membrane protein
VTTKGDWRDEGSEANIEVERILRKTRSWQFITVVTAAVCSIVMVSVMIAMNRRGSWLPVRVNVILATLTWASYFKAEHYRLQLRKLTRDRR